MKRLLLIIFIIATAATAFSTGQITEKINDNGVNKGLARCLLELDSISFSELKERIPKEMVSTALWRNYIGHWKIKGDSLFLDSVLVMDKTCDTLRFIPAKIDDIYAARRTPSGYFADWVTDTLRVVSGDIVLYEHMGWNSYWEDEEYLSVKDGLVMDRLVYKNRIVNPISESEINLKEVIDSLDLGYIPKKMLLQIGFQGFTENGDATGYKVKVLRSCGDTIVDNRVVGAFKNSILMRRLIPIYHLRGQYKSPEGTIAIPESRDTQDISD